MATYNAALKGYVADVPKVIFRRCDGKAYAFDELTAATVSANIDTMDINAGWSLFPVAVLPGSSTFTMSFTSGKFDADLFAMANKTEFTANAAYELDTAERLTIDSATHKAVLQNEAVTSPKSTIYIDWQ